jgi:dimethylargininase
VLPAALEPYRTLRFLEAPATLDGGDVLHIGRALYIGSGGRSNAAGIAQLADLLAPYGYTVHPAGFEGCLHLKSAVTSIGHDLLLANTAWVDTSQFAGCQAVAVPADEAHAANALTVADVTLLPAGYPRTEALLEAQGFTIRPVDISELEKAEAGVTCSSLLFTA